MWDSTEEGEIPIANLAKGENPPEEEPKCFLLKLCLLIRTEILSEDSEDLPGRCSWKKYSACKKQISFVQKVVWVGEQQLYSRMIHAVYSTLMMKSVLSPNGLPTPQATHKEACLPPVHIEFKVKG